MKNLLFLNVYVRCWKKQAWGWIKRSSDILRKLIFVDLWVFLSFVAFTPPKKSSWTTSQAIFLHVREAASGVPSPSWNQALHPPMNALKPHLLEQITRPLQPSLGLARWRAATGHYCGLLRWPPLSINVFVIICWVWAFHLAGEWRAGDRRASGGG